MVHVWPSGSVFGSTSTDPLSCVALVPRCASIQSSKQLRLSVTVWWGRSRVWTIWSSLTHLWIILFESLLCSFMDLIKFRDDCHLFLHLREHCLCGPWSVSAQHFAYPIMTYNSPREMLGWASLSHGRQLEARAPIWSTEKKNDAEIHSLEWAERAILCLWMRRLCG